jgi:4-amino-4-deoxy-L-arabinose transferase-like glycosyltransferase
MIPSLVAGMLVASVSRLKMDETTKIADDAITAPIETVSIAPETPPPAEHAPRWLMALARPAIAIAALLAFSALLYCVNLGGYPFYTKGEPREAVTVLAIATGGGVILPMRAGIELPSKPLLMHWIAALLSMLAGSIDEWTIRMPSALFGIGGVLACYYYVRRLFDDCAALFAAVILATSVLYLQSATGARVDMTLSFLMEVAFFEFLLIGEGLTRRRNLLYVAIAMAVLAKGPVGLVLPGAVALAWITVQWRWSVLRDLKLARGAAIVAILAGWWYVAAAIIGGMPFIQKQLIAENFVRFVGAAQFHEGHAHPFYYLEGALAGGFLPWTPILALVAWRALRAPRPLDSRLKYLLIWFVVVLGFYSFSHSKRGVYLLPLYPALATLTALYVVDAIGAPASSERLVAFFSGLYGAALAVAGFGALLALVMIQIFPSAFASILHPVLTIEADFTDALHAVIASRLPIAIGIPIIAVAVGIYLAGSARSPQKLTLAIAGGFALIAIAANVIVVPAVANTLALKDFTANVMKTVGDHPIAYLLDMDYDVAFYSRRTIPIVSFKDANKPEYLLCWDSIWEQPDAGVQHDYQVIMTSNATSLDGTDHLLLLKKTAAPSNDVNV